MKILLVEDHPIIVAGCRYLFEQFVDFLIIVAPTIAEARQEQRQHAPDVIVIDINLPGGTGLAFVRQLTEWDTDAKVVAFSMWDDPGQALQAIDHGAHGFVGKYDGPTALVTAVQAVGRGEKWLSEENIRRSTLLRAGRQSRPPKLTRREKNVLKLIVGGGNVSEIAAELNISEGAVATDCKAIRQKLRARTTAELVAIAVNSNLD